MKPYITLIAAVMMNSLSHVSGEPDHQLRAFLGITSVSTKVTIEEPASYIEVFVFKGGEEVARLPSGVTGDPTPHEKLVSLMFDNKGVVKLISGGSTSDFTNQLDWSEIFKATGGKGWTTGTTDKPIGMIGEFKAVAVVQGEQLDSGSVRFNVKSNMEMDESISRAIQGAESCVVIGIRSGSQKEMEKGWLNTLNTNKKGSSEKSVGEFWFG
jgi:hypothetical protein